MFSKDQKFERQTEPVAEEIGELSDDQLDAIVGGTQPPDSTNPSVTCIYCGMDQPPYWTDDYCWYCGAPFPIAPKIEFPV